MKKMYLLAMGFLLLFFKGGMAQDKSYFSELVPPSPDIAQLGQYGATQVGKYTGTANVSVPLHTINFDGLNIPIALSYATGGVKVSQEASWAGLGWNLSANAIIARQINGYDDLINGDGAVGYLFSPVYTYPISQAQEDELLFANGAGQLAIDTEPDIFTLNIFGESVQFMLPKQSGSNILTAEVLNNKVVKVYYDVANKTFEVINGSGFTFLFQSKEYTTSYRSAGSSGATTDASALTDDVSLQTIDQGRTTNKITGWHIDKVIAPTGRELTFTYRQSFYFGFPSYSSNNSYTSCSIVTEELAYETLEVDYSPTTCSITAFDGLQLTQISGDFGSVDFTLSDRLDISSNFQTTLPFTSVPSNQEIKRLSGIVVKNPKNETIKTITLNQSYFNDQYLNNSNKERYLRLKLDDVQVNNMDYAFSYISPNNLPTKDSHSEDFWGYYNGKTNISRIPSFARIITCNTQGRDIFLTVEGANKGSDINYGKIGLLNEVTYPTKGKTVFEYEANRASIEKPLPNFNIPFPNSIDFSYNYLYLWQTEFGNFEHDLPSTGTTTFTIDQTAVFGYNFKATGNVYCAAQCGGGLSGVPYITIRNVSTGVEDVVVRYLEQNFDEERTLAPGTYEVTVHPYTSSPGQGFASASNDMYYIADPEGNPFPFKEFEVGGARLKSVTNYNDDDSFISKKQYTYEQSRWGQIVSSGVLMNELVYHSKFGVFEYSPQSSTFNMSSGSSLSLDFSAQGSHIGYSYVKEEDVDANGNTKGNMLTAYVNEKNEIVTKLIGVTLVISEDMPPGVTNNYPDVAYGNAYLLGVAPRSFSYKNGSVVFENIEGDSFNILRSTNNTYEDIEISSIPVYKAYLHNNVNLIEDYEYFQKGNQYLPKTSVNKQYFGSISDSVATTTTNTYETSRYLPRSRITTTSETGITQKEEWYYPFDSSYGVSSLANMNNLLSQNRVTEPILTRVYENNTLLSQTLTKYGSFSGKYWRNEVQDAKDDDALESRALFTSYDSFGNVREYKLTDGSPVTYIWGYNTMYPVAKVENATYSDALGTGINLSLLNNVNTTDTQMRIELDKLRTLTGALVTTYTYKQGVGISSMTDPSGYTMSYEYDQYNRLKRVKDADGNIISENDYHYKGEQ